MTRSTRDWNELGARASSSILIQTLTRIIHNLIGMVCWEILVSPGLLTKTTMMPSCWTNNSAFSVSDHQALSISFAARCE